MTPEIEAALAELKSIDGKRGRAREVAQIRLHVLHGETIKRALTATSEKPQSVDLEASKKELIYKAKSEMVTVDGISASLIDIVISAIEDTIEQLAARGLITSRVPDFQSRVKPWMDACFGPEISADKIERNHRFLEEALELVQANGCTKSEAHQLVDYVYGRDIREINQEVGGVMVTLAALCLANGIDMHQGGETELARIWTKVEKIRAKQAAKPMHSPLPERTAPPAPAAVQDAGDVVTVEDIGLTNRVATAMQYLNCNPESDAERRSALEALWLAATRFNEIVRDVLVSDFTTPPADKAGA